MLPVTTLLSCPFTDALHHNPAVWGDDHMEYKPDRFLPENVENMDSHAFCPFSAGSRFVSRIMIGRYYSLVNGISNLIDYNSVLCKGHCNLLLQVVIRNLDCSI